MGELGKELGKLVLWIMAGLVVMVKTKLQVSNMERNKSPEMCCNCYKCPLKLGSTSLLNYPNSLFIENEEGTRSVNARGVSDAHSLEEECHRDK